MVCICIVCICRVYMYRRYIFDMSLVCLTPRGSILCVCICIVYLCRLYISLGSLHTRRYVSNACVSCVYASCVYVSTIHIRYITSLSYSTWIYHLMCMYMILGSLHTRRYVSCVYVYISCEYVSRVYVSTIHIRNVECEMRLFHVSEYITRFPSYTAIRVVCICIMHMHHVCV